MTAQETERLERLATDLSREHQARIDAERRVSAARDAIERLHRDMAEIRAERDTLRQAVNALEAQLAQRQREDDRRSGWWPWR